jgi:hypothetical protein
MKDAGRRGGGGGVKGAIWERFVTQSQIIRSIISLGKEPHKTMQAKPNQIKCRKLDCGFSQKMIAIYFVQICLQMFRVGIVSCNKVPNLTLLSTTIKTCPFYTRKLPASYLLKCTQSKKIVELLHKMATCSNLSTNRLWTLGISRPYVRTSRGFQEN